MLREGKPVLTILASWDWVSPEEKAATAPGDTAPGRGVLSHLPPQSREASFDLCWGWRPHVLSQSQKQIFLLRSSVDKQPATLPRLALALTRVNPAAKRNILSLSLTSLPSQL